MLSSILVLAPALVLLIGAAILLLMRLFKSTAGYTWLVAAFTALVGWGLVLFTRFRLPMTINLPGWQEFSVSFSEISFTADRLSWPIETALITLVLGVIFTDTARYTQLTRSTAWAGSMAMAALGSLASLSAQPLGLILGWTALDLIEFFLLVGVASEGKMLRQVIASLGYKIGGTVAVLGVILANPGLVEDGQSIQLSLQASIALLFGLGLRLGALPLHPPFYREPQVRRGLGTVLRLAPAAPALVFLARFTPERLIWASTPGVIILLAGAVFYGAWMWLRSEDELIGRPFWIIALASLAITCSLRNHSEGVIAWGVVMILSGGILFLFSARGKRLIVFPLLAMLGFSGLPYTPAASAWPGLAGSPLPGLIVIYIFSLGVLLVGYYRKARQPKDSLDNLERWVSLIYPLGLLAMTAVLLVMGYIGWPGSRSSGVWWASAVVMVLAAGWIFSSTAVSVPTLLPVAVTRLSSTLGKQLRLVMQRILELDWLNRLLLAGYRLLSLVVSQVAFLLEGDAGVLWTLVLLTLFLTVLNAGGRP